MLAGNPTDSGAWRAPVTGSQGLRRDRAVLARHTARSRVGEAAPPRAGFRPELLGDLTPALRRRPAAQPGGSDLLYVSVRLTPTPRRRSPAHSEAPPSRRVPCGLLQRAASVPEPLEDSARIPYTSEEIPQPPV